MKGTWQEGLMFLHARGWSGELIDEACTILLEACREGEVSELTADEAHHVLAQRAAGDEIRMLCQLAELHDRMDAAGQAFRAALLDLDAFADSLGADYDASSG